MSGSRIKKTTATCLALLLSGAVLSQAAGPGEFLSGIWKKRPQVSKSRLNPKNWRKKETPAPDATGRVRIGALNSIRENLENDPFRAESSNALRNLVNDNDGGSNNVAKQSTAAHRSQVGQRHPSPSFGQPTTIDKTSPQIDRAGSRDRIRTLAEQTSQDRHEDATAAVLRRQDEAVKRRQIDVGAQDFTPGFEALVQEVLAEREGRSKAQATQQGRQPDLPPSIFDETPKSGRKNSLDASSFYETESKLAADSQRQDVVDRLVRERQFAEIERERLGQDANFDNSKDIDAPPPRMQINPGPLPGQDNSRVVQGIESNSDRGNPVDQRLAFERERFRSRNSQFESRDGGFNSQDEFANPRNGQRSRQNVSQDQGRDNQFVQQRQSMYEDRAKSNADYTRQDTQSLADSRRFRNEWSRQNVKDLIDQSRREMRTDIRQPTDRSNLQTVSRYDDQQRPSDSDSDLRLLGDRSPVVLSPQLPLDKHQYLRKSNRQEDLRDSQKLDDGWDRNQREMPRSRMSDQSMQQPFRQTRPEQDRVQTAPKREQIKMIITPRVTSNQAPRLSVPNNQQYRRMSYEEEASKQRVEIARNDDQPPFLMMPAEENRNAEKQPTAHGSQSTQSLIAEEVNPMAAGQQKTQAADVSGSSSLGPVNWGDAPDVVAPASASLPWMMMATIAVCTAAIISFLIVRTRKIGMVASDTTNARDEAN